MGMGSRSLDSTAGTQVEVVSRPLGSRSSDPGPGFSLGGRTLALRISGRAPGYILSALALIRDQAEEALRALRGVRVWAGGAKDVREVARWGRGRLQIEA